MTTAPLKLAVLGGTGAQGSGLALRWARAGHHVTIGSRDPEKAKRVAEELNGQLGRSAILGASYLGAAQQAEVVVLTVPYAAQHATAMEVRDAVTGKVLIDVTVPLVPPKVSTVQLPLEGSAVKALQQKLGPSVRIVSAFQNISAQHLADLDHDVDCDVLICGDDDAACEVAVRLATDAGTRGWRAGPLANSVVAEALTSALIAINRRYKIPGAGIRITGEPGRP
jgi:NADPH-dependent F420 reductase